MVSVYQDDWLTIYGGDCRTVLAELPAESVHCVVTSPPYWGLRDYGVTDQLGLEPTPEQYVENMVAVFREVRRVLRSDGTVWLNLGDSYAHTTDKHPPNRGLAAGKERQDGHKRNAENWSTMNGDVQGGVVRDLGGLKPKDLVGIPWRIAFALQADGWYLRSDIIWSKPNPMPESVTDRPTKSHEYLFLLAKSARYFFDAEAVRAPVSDTPGAAAWRRTFDPLKQDKESELQATGLKGGNTGGNTNGHCHPENGRNIRTVWTVATQPYPGAHFAVFPEKLIEPCILAGCPVDGVVLDPFGGSGTTARVANRLSRRAVLIDLNPEYLKQQMDRNRDIPLGLGA